MSIAPKDAARALDDIQSAREKSATLRGYTHSSGHLIIWGLVWMAGGAFSYAAPDIGRWVWPAASVLGAVASIILSARAPRAAGGRGATGKVALTMLAAAATSTAIAIVLGADTLREITALLSLLVAGAYVAFGIWRGLRIVALGLALAATVLVGWFYLGDAFQLSVGVVGGLLLVLSGLWLRKA
jgi:hypothetical protein